MFLFSASRRVAGIHFLQANQSPLERLNQKAPTNETIQQALFTRLVCGLAREPEEVHLLRFLYTIFDFKFRVGYSLGKGSNAANGYR